MGKIDTLDPSFKEKVQELLAKAEEATGLKWIITSGRRTMAEQQKLYDQGRKTPGPVVTKAPPGSSAHNFGLAADLAPMKDGALWWEAPKSVWKEMGDEAESLGLVWGGNFTTIFDQPHVEAKTWREERAKWQSGELRVA